MPPKKPTVAPLMMTLRSRGRNQDIPTKESKLEVAEEESKRKVRKTSKQEAVEEELNNNVAKDQSEQKVCEEKLKPAATTRVERRKREGEEAHRDAKLAKIVAVVTEEKKKNVRQCKNKSCEAPEESRTEVQKAVVGNEESDQVEAVKENKKKRKTVTGRLQSRQPRSDALSAESQSDEKVETFSTEDWSVIEGIKARAERIFDVKLVACQEERSKAANITISGSNRETRLLCKEYLFALTRPGCATIFPYPPEKHSFLTESAVHEKLERDSQAFLTFHHIGEVEIYGLDSLSVALAMSSLESMLENHHKTESNAPSVSDNARREKEDLTKRQESSRRSSLLLDAELKNWMSSSEDEVYRNTNEAVRHSILSVVKDESREVRMEAAKIHGSPLKAASPALRSSALKLLSEAYVSLLDDSAAPLSPFATDGNEMASLGTESVGKNILKDPDFASCSLQHKEKMLAEAETMQREIENSAIETETKQSEITSSFTADKTIQDRKNLTTEAKTKQKEITNEHIIARDSESKINGIIVSSDSECEAEKDRHYRSKTTSIKSNIIDRKVNLHKNGLSCEIRVPSGNQKPGQIHSQKVGISLPAPELHGTRNSCSHASATLDNQMVSSATKTIQVDSVSSTKLLSDSLKQVQLTQNPTAAGSNPSAPPVIYPLLSIAAQPSTSSLASAGKLRYVVIDGSNVAMAHGKNQAFSCPGIEICIKYFLQRGHREDQITAFVPQSRLCRPRPSHKPIVGQHLLQKLADRGLVVFTPARKVPGRNIVCYDDRYVLRLAAHTNGIIVTNDNYRDLWLERGEWREIIENRLLPFSFVNDLFMPPDDPLGRNGPSLNQFLTDQQQQPHLGQRNRNANPQTGNISTNAKLVSVKQWYQNR